MMQIIFKSNIERPFHKDLHIVIPEIDIDKYVDTYFFVTDTGFLSEEETDEKVQISLKNLLHEWVETIDGLNEGYIAYLPFDFSDQYIGALRVQRYGSDAVIRYAWNREMGGMNPSYFKRGFLLDKDFIVDIKSARMPLVKLIVEIEEQISLY